MEGGPEPDISSRSPIQRTYILKFTFPHLNVSQVVAHAMVHYNATLTTRSSSGSLRINTCRSVVIHWKIG